MNRFLQFFEESPGMLSSNRAMFMLSSTAVISTWMINSLAKMELQSIPESVIILIGTFMAGKVIQKFGESKNGNGKNTAQ